ncbi:MAG: LysR family transcriptional regulator [Paracoccaceae bacterium]
MVNRLRNLPTMKSIVAFQVVLRHRSFSRAAETLGMSQSGISRQIAQLETFVGTALFARDAAGVRLTPAGEEYAAGVATAMDAMMALGETSHAWIGRDRVTLACSPGVADLWILPRLRGLRDAFPDLEIKLLVYDSFTRLRSDEYDLAISFHDRRPDLTIMGELGGEDTVPVMSPALPPLQEQTAPVILTMDGSLREWTDWNDWLDAAGLVLPEATMRWKLGSYRLCIEAAAQGLGVAMGWSWLLQDDLASGRLVVAHPLHFRAPSTYYLTMSGHRNQRPVARRVGQWLLDNYDAGSAYSA